MKDRLFLGRRLPEVRDPRFTGKLFVIEGADGSVLHSESLAAKATEETEFCEGYAEP